MRNVSTVHLPAADEQEAFEAAQQVELLTEMPGWDFLMEAVKSKVEHLRTQLTNGVKGTPADYERIIGEMRGVESIEAIANGLLKRGGVGDHE